MVRTFEERVEQLKKFLEDHAGEGEGDKWPKRGGTRPEEKGLADWISYVRHGKGQLRVTPEMEEALEQIGGWEW